MPHNDIESHIQARIRLAIGAPGTGITVWRNQVGTGWQGANPLGRMTVRPLTAAQLPEARAALRPGDVILRHPRMLTAGLCPGSSDLIGLRQVTITPDMVGQTVGVFVAVEVKVPEKKPDPAQRTFLDYVSRAGGVAGVARSVGEAWGLFK